MNNATVVMTVIHQNINVYRVKTGTVFSCKCTLRLDKIYREDMIPSETLVVSASVITLIEWRVYFLTFIKKWKKKTSQKI